MERFVCIALAAALLGAGAVRPAGAAAQLPRGAELAASLVERPVSWQALTTQPGHDSVWAADRLVAAPHAVSEAPAAAVVVVGVIGGWALGALAGGLLGHVVGPRYASEYAPLSDGAAIGALVGMAVGSGLGAHLTNRRRGSALWPALGSAAATAGLVLIASAVEDDARRAAVLLIPVAQVGTAVLVERLTSR